jgi:hemoglobin
MKWTKAINKALFTGATVSALLLIPILSAGCGGSGERQNKDFFTSGSAEADQRADQRMAQSQQLKGNSGDSGKPVLGEDTRSLYERLGGETGLAAISDDFVTRAMSDPRVNFQRKGITQGGLSIHREASMEWTPDPQNVKMVKFHIAQFLAVATGGPSLYEGKQMKDAHANMHITNAEFDASVGDMKATLDKMKIANKEQKELLAILETTRTQIVEEQ